ncbi:MAG: hypothetical protein CL916_15285 [Deltaproteobacteria bacterium]|nr:hypothetical protein [Deltaproteobacteria bacterium]
MILMEEGKFERAIDTANRITDDIKKSSAFAYIAKILTEQGTSSILHHHLLKYSFSDFFYESFLPSYQKILTETQLLRYSFLYMPFSYEIALASAYNFFNHQLRLENETHYVSIINHCPQLGLHFLLPSASPTRIS